MLNQSSFDKYELCCDPDKRIDTAEIATFPKGCITNDLLRTPSVHFAMCI